MIRVQTFNVVEPLQDEGNGRRPVALIECDDGPFTVEVPGSTPSIPAFVFTSLDLEEFRLAELPPGAFSSPIHCSIQTYKLDAFNLPPFRALSYTRVDSEDDQLIVGGQRMPQDAERR